MATGDRMCGSCPGLFRLAYSSRCWVTDEQLSCLGIVNDVTCEGNGRKEVRLDTCKRKPKSNKECNQMKREFDASRANQGGLNHGAK